MNGELSDIIWKLKVENMNCIQAWEAFSTEVMSKLDKYIPMFMSNQKKCKSICMTREALALQKRKQRCWSKYTVSESDDDDDKYIKVKLQNIS